MITCEMWMALVPLIGQNWRVGKFKCIHETRNFSIKFVVIYESPSFCRHSPAKPVSSIFTDMPEVLEYSKQYLRVMVFGIAGLNVSNWMSRAFTTIGKPFWTVIINVVVKGLVGTPLAYLGKAVHGYIQGSWRESPSHRYCLARERFS
jgi:Na+-driven multidrug efflux pump